GVGRAPDWAPADVGGTLLAPLYIALARARHNADARKAVWCRVRLRALVSLGVRAWSKRRVTIRTREIYHSANGDRWLLARNPDTGQVFVRHEPNLPSGGEVADIEVGAFLIAAGNGPEKQELLRLIGTLV